MLQIPKIFVSYARIDDQPVHGQELGWISLFIDNLGTETGRVMGRSEHFSVWMDFKLNANDSLTPEIEQQLRDADVLLIMMSRGWLKSDWCVKELEYFRAVKSDLGKRVFVVNLNGVPREKLPESFEDLVPIPFYEENKQGKIRQLGYPVPETSDKDYFYRTVDLAEQLATTLQLFSKQSIQSSSPKIAEVKATVYVAPVPDSLFDQRSMLISELAQFAIQALPATNRHEAAMDRTLQQCSHFIQLLDNDFAMGMPFDQHLIAQTAEKEIIQWRDSQLAISQNNHEQHALLEGKTVIACELTDFIRLVRETVLPEKKDHSEVHHNDKKMVFIHSTPEDTQRAQQIKQAIRSKGFTTLLPDYTGKAQRIRKLIERGYLECDILLLLREKASADVIEDYLFDVRTAMLKRATELQIMVCTHEDCQEFALEIEGMKTFACNHNFHEHCFEQFLAEIEA